MSRLALRGILRRHDLCVAGDLEIIDSRLPGGWPVILRSGLHLVDPVADSRRVARCSSVSMTLLAATFPDTGGDPAERLETCTALQWVRPSPCLLLSTGPGL